MGAEQPVHSGLVISRLFTIHRSSSGGRGSWKRGISRHPGGSSPPGLDLVNAMQAGELDLGYIGLPPVIIGVDRGIPLKCIAGGHIEGTVMIAGKDVLPLAGCPGMREFLTQFAGRAVGTPPRGSIHDVIVNELSERARDNRHPGEKLSLGGFSPRRTQGGRDRGSRGDAGPRGGSPPVFSGRARRSPGQALAFQPELWYCRDGGSSSPGRTSFSGSWPRTRLHAR